MNRETADKYFARANYWLSEESPAEARHIIGTLEMRATMEEVDLDSEFGKYLTRNIELFRSRAHSMTWGPYGEPE